MRRGLRGGVGNARITELRCLYKFIFIHMKNFTYIDIHCHPNLPEFDSDRQEVLARMADAQVAGIVVGTRLDTSYLAVEIAGSHDHLWAIIGQHPNDIEDTFDADSFRNMITHPRVVGVGECGYDFFRTEKTWEHMATQEKNFRAHIELALEYDKPLMLHLRASKGTQDAYEAALTTLQEYKADAGERLRGDVHFFAGSVDIARRFLDLGFYISFTGVLTFTHDYDEVVRATPLDRILAETDAPYAAPVPYRGGRCEPQHVIEVYKKIAEIKELDPELVRVQILKNAQALFGVKL